MPDPWIPDPWTPDPCALNPYASFVRFWSAYLFEMVLLTALGGTTAPELDSKGLLGWVPGCGGFDFPCVQPILNFKFINKYLKRR